MHTDCLHVEDGRAGLDLDALAGLNIHAAGVLPVPIVMWFVLHFVHWFNTRLKGTKTGKLAELPKRWKYRRKQKKKAGNLESIERIMCDEQLGTSRSESGSEVRSVNLVSAGLRPVLFGQGSTVPQTSHRVRSGGAGTSKLRPRPESLEMTTVQGDFGVELSVGGTQRGSC